MSDINAQLERFAEKHKIKRKGALSLVLVLTRRASKRKPPYAAKHFLTPQGGQVAGLSGAAVQTILQEHRITRVLAEEGGRTSRGGILRMRAYVKLLNKLAKEGLLDFSAIERWWVDRIKHFFASQPFRIRIDPSRSLRSIVAELIESAFSRQKECPGTMTAGAVMQHLVGAKLEIALPQVEVEHKGFSVADSPRGSRGDFQVGDAAIHVTTAPSEALIRKCCENLAGNLRPVVITTEGGAAGATALARNADVAERIDILEVEQFLATNVYEWSAFKQANRPLTVRELAETYNRIIDQCETDPSLKIAVG